VATHTLPTVEAFRDFFIGEFERASKRIEREDRIPPELIQRTAELGAFRLTVPESRGGFGLGVVDVLPYLEAASEGPAAGRMLVHVLNGMWRPLEAFGSPEQQDLIGRQAAGDAIVGVAVTEREGGSGRDLRTTAVRDGAGWRLCGEKYLITFADIASHVIVLAVTDENRGPDCLTTFLVPTDAAGVKASAEPLIGLAGIRLGSLRLDTVLSDSDRLGELGQGFAVMQAFLDYSRISLSACMVGFGRRCLDEAVAFAKRRVTFGKPVAERQAIQVQLAEMYSRLLAARSTVQAVAARSARGEDFAVDAAAAKMFCADVATGLADACLRIHGGYGLTKASVVERLVRDSRSWWMEEGTAEIQSLLIARRILR
jgi:alkylation response protein AidB-like acyl-CoA dehydrogenase